MRNQLSEIVLVQGGKGRCLNRLGRIPKHVGKDGRRRGMIVLLHKKHFAISDGKLCSRFIEDSCGTNARGANNVPFRFSQSKMFQNCHASVRLFDSYLYGTT